MAALVIGNKKKKVRYSDGVFNEEGAPKVNGQQPIAHTLDPIVTGSSVIALKFNGGVIIGSDTLLSYGSSSKFKNIQRIQKISNNVVLASTGEYSDFQEVVDILRTREKEQFLHDDNVRLTPQNYGNYLARLSYARRNKFDPFFLNTVVAGFDERSGGAYIATVDTVGTYIEDQYAATGFAMQMCKPIIESYWAPDRDEQTTRQVLIKCFQNLVYRDARATDTVQFAVIDKQGTRIEAPFRLETKWDYAGYKFRANEKLHTQ